MIIISEHIGSLLMELHLEVEDQPQIEELSRMMKECVEAAEEGIKLVYNRYCQKWDREGLLSTFEEKEEKEK